MTYKHLQFLSVAISFTLLLLKPIYQVSMRFIVRMEYASYEQITN